MTKYQVCDHPELLTKDGRCFLCLELDGQVDVFSILKTSPKDHKNHDKTTRKW